jgi:hypothetical protein
MGDTRNSDIVFVVRLPVTRKLGIPRRRWEDKIRIGLQKISCDDGRWMELAQDHVQWRDLVLAVLNLRVLLPECVSYKTVGLPGSFVQFRRHAPMTKENNAICKYLRKMRLEKKKKRIRQTN